MAVSCHTLFLTIRWIWVYILIIDLISDINCQIMLIKDINEFEENTKRLIRKGNKYI